MITVSYSSAACPAGWFAGGPHCFYVNDGGEVNWGEAEVMLNLKYILRELDIPLLLFVLCRYYGDKRLSQMKEK